MERPGLKNRFGYTTLYPDANEAGMISNGAVNYSSVKRRPPFSKFRPAIFRG